MGFTLYQTGILHKLPDRLAFEQDNITVGELFALLADQHGEQVLEEVLDDERKIAAETLVILNGHILQSESVLTTTIPPGSELVVSTLIAGG